MEFHIFPSSMLVYSKDTSRKISDSKMAPVCDGECVCECGDLQLTHYFMQAPVCENPKRSAVYEI